MLVTVLTTAAQLVTHRADGSTQYIDAWGDDSLRVRIVPPGGRKISVPIVQGLLPAPPESSLHAAAVVIGTDTLTNGNMRVDVDAQGRPTFVRVSDGRVMLTETDALIRRPSAASPTWTADVIFAGLTRDEYVYGLGEHRGSSRCDNQCIPNATLPLRQWNWKIQDSQNISRLPNNGNAWIPWYASSRGYGFLWNMASYGIVHLGYDGITWSSNATRQIDYYITTTEAPSLDPPAAPVPPYRDLMRHYAAATGRPPPLPYAYTGFWQCKLRYSSQFQVERIAAGYVERGLPLSVIVIDYHHWVHDGDWRFSDDKNVPNHTDGCWPDPSAMVRNLSSLGVVGAVSVWPDVAQDSINWANMSARGLLVRGADGTPAPSAQGRYFVDAFNPEARTYFFGQLHAGYVSHGIEAFWLDATEPQGAAIGDWYFRMDDGSLRSSNEVAMGWVQQYHRGVREGLERQARQTSGRLPNAKPLPPFLSRAAFAGSQRYGAILWSGDIESSFNELAVQVQVAQHVAMSGIYLWTTDIGGFRNGNISDPSFRELAVRWFQFGAFCPIFRLHGNREGPSDVDVCGHTTYNEIWHFGEEAYRAIASVMRLREALRPYVAAGLAQATAEGTPLLRPMTFDFVDEECVAAVDQYMFGDTYLVAPVLARKAMSRSVYLPRLPPGEAWMYHYDPTSAPYEDGKRHVVLTTDLSEFPLFVRRTRA